MATTGRPRWGPEADESKKLGTGTVPAALYRDPERYALERERLFLRVHDIVDDLVLLQTLSEEAIVSNLSNTYHKSRIYTAIGPVLLSINPFQEIGGLYAPQLAAKYRRKQLGELAPHVFAVAESAWKSLVEAGMKKRQEESAEAQPPKVETLKWLQRRASPPARKRPVCPHLYLQRSAPHPAVGRGCRARQPLCAGERRGRAETRGPRRLADGALGLWVGRHRTRCVLALAAAHSSEVTALPLSPSHSLVMPSAV